MKRFFVLISILLIFGTLSAKFELFQLPHDKRNWIYIGETKVGEAAFVIRGDTGSEWQEAIIFRFVPTPEGLSLDDFFKEYNRVITQDERITTKVLLSEEELLLFEWWTDPEKKEAQHGWIQITKAPGGVKLFRYTTKILSEIEETGKEWTDLMTRSTFAMTPYNYNININWNNVDGKTWFEKSHRDGIFRYFPEGQYQGNWKEKFTFIVIGKYIDHPLATHFKAVVQTIKREQGEEIQVTPIALTEEILFFQWKSDREAELYKVQRLAPSSSVIMRYTAKADDENLEYWREVMENLNITVDYSYTLVPLPRRPETN